LGSYESQGRWELSDTYPINPSLGYDAFYLDINSKDPRLPKHLVDTSFAFGSPLAKYGDWFVAASAGFGYAGNAPLTQGNAYYGKATVLVGKQLGPDSTLIFGIDYDGNRPDFPDIPLPGFAYTLRINPTLLAEVGFPYSKITWTPIDQFKALLKYTFYRTIEAETTYDFTKHWGVFASFVDKEEAFRDTDLPHNRRAFFEQQRIESGLRWNACKSASLVAAVGYAFDTKFNVGFNALDAGNLLHASEEPYVRVGLEVGW